jgi:hypothetical protein
MCCTLLNLTNNAVSNFLTHCHGLKFLIARRNQYINIFSTTKSKIAVSNFVSCSLQLGGRRRSLDIKTDFRRLQNLTGTILKNSSLMRDLIKSHPSVMRSQRTREASHKDIEYLPLEFWTQKKFSKFLETDANLSPARFPAVAKRGLFTHWEKEKI